MINANVIRGFEIIGKCLRKDDRDVHAEHDILYVGEYDKVCKKLTADEVSELNRLGWFESESSWACYT